MFLVSILRRQGTTVLVYEGILDIIEGKLPVEDLKVLLLCLEDLVEVLSHPAHWILIHHVRSGGRKQRLLQGLLICDDDLKDVGKSIDEEEAPTHGRDVGGIQAEQVDTLLSHLLELLPQGERHLCNDETLEYRANGLEDHDIQHTLNILLDHVADHVGICHHLRHLIELDFLLKVASVFCAKVRLALFDTLLGQEVGILSYSSGAEHGTPVLHIIFYFLERRLNIHLIGTWVRLDLLRNIGLVLEHCAA